MAGQRDAAQATISPLEAIREACSRLHALTQAPTFTERQGIVRSLCRQIVATPHSATIVINLPGMTADVPIANTLPCYSVGNTVLRFSITVPVGKRS